MFHSSYQYDDNVQYIPDATEVGELVYAQLENLLDDIVEDEHTKDQLTAEDEVIPGGNVTNQPDCPYLVGRDRTAGRWEFNHQPEKSR